MTNEKHFPKTISQWEFDYGLFTNLPRIIVTCDFSPRYPNLKTTCHIKLKFFLWTKLLENLLQAKHFISVAAPLNNQITWSAHLFLKKELDDGNMNSSQWWIICFTDPEMDTDCKVKCEPLPCWLCPRKNQKCKSFVIIP